MTQTPDRNVTEFMNLYAVLVDTIAWLAVGTVLEASDSGGGVVHWISGESGKAIDCRIKQVEADDEDHR